MQQKISNDSQLLFLVFVSLLLNMSACSIVVSQSFTFPHFRNITHIDATADHIIFFTTPWLSSSSPSSPNNKNYLAIQNYQSWPASFTQMPCLANLSNFISIPPSPLDNSLKLIQTIPTGNQFSVNLTDSTITQINSHDFSTYYRYFIKGIKNAVYYVLVLDNWNGNNGTFYTNVKISPNSNTSLFQFQGKTVEIGVNQFGQFLFLHENTTVGTVMLSLYEANGTHAYTQEICGISVSSNYFLTTTYYHTIIAVTNNNISQIWCWSSKTKSISWSTSSSKVISVHSIYPWLCILSVSSAYPTIYNTLTQYYIEDGSIFQIKPVALNRFEMHYDYLNAKYWLIGDANGNPNGNGNGNGWGIGYKMELRDEYVFGVGIGNQTGNGNNLGSGDCFVHYVKSLDGRKCIASTPFTIEDAINSTAFKFVYPNLTLNSSANNSQLYPIILPQNSSLSPSYNVFSNTNICFKKMPSSSITKQLPISSKCQIFCHQKCSSCSTDPTVCDSCSQYYMMSQKSMTCQLQTNMYIVSLVYAFVNSIKCSKTLAIFAYLNNLDLYRYHNIQYTGIMEQIFNLLNFMQKKQWQLVPIPQIQSFLSYPLFPPSFLPYTSPSFSAVQRKDLSFIQNTKPYFVIYIPFICFLFLIQNRLFYLTFHYKISLFFRLFSFWLYLLGLVVFNDLQRVAYLAVQQLAGNLYQFQGIGKIVQTCQIGIIGIGFICALSVYLGYQTLYGQHLRYFLSNLKIGPGCCLIMVAKYVIKPIIQGTIQCLLAEKSLIPLIFIEFSTFFLSSFLQLKQNLIQIKILFAAESMLQFSTILMNIYLYLKHICPLSNQSLYNCMQQCIIVLVHVTSFTLAMCFMLGICQSFKDCFGRRGKNGDKRITHFMGQSMEKENSKQFLIKRSKRVGNQNDIGENQAKKENHTKNIELKVEDMLNQQNMFKMTSKDIKVVKDLFFFKRGSRTVKMHQNKASEKQQGLNQIQTSETENFFMTKNFNMHI